MLPLALPYIWFFYVSQNSNSLHFLIETKIPITPTSIDICMDHLYLSKFKLLELFSLNNLSWFDYVFFPVHAFLFLKIYLCLMVKAKCLIYQVFTYID